jgi:hypothetical protein
VVSVFFAKEVRKRSITISMSAPPSDFTLSKAVSTTVRCDTSPSGARTWAIAADHCASVMGSLNLPPAAV